jgi:hypothetical protein
MTMVILCRNEQLRFQHITKIIGALMGFVVVFDHLVLMQLCLVVRYYRLSGQPIGPNLKVQAVQ